MSQNLSSAAVVIGALRADKADSGRRFINNLLSGSLNQAPS